MQDMKNSLEWFNNNEYIDQCVSGGHSTRHESSAHAQWRPVWSSGHRTESAMFSHGHHHTDSHSTVTVSCSVKYQRHQLLQCD